MKISHLTIHQFRSINHIELTVHDMLVVLGQNNHGKSNVLRAFEYLLTSSIKGIPEDLFSHRQDHDLELWVEAVFSNLTEAERRTFQKYVGANGSIRIRKMTQFPTDRKPVTTYHGWLEEAEDEFLKESAVGDLTTRDAINRTPLAGLVPASGRITQAQVRDAQAHYIAEHRKELRFNYTMETGPLLGQNTVAAGVLPDFYLVPAVRDLSSESKTSSTALFGKLLGHAIEQMTLGDMRFQRIRTELAALVRSFNGDAEEPRPLQMTELERSIEDELRDWGCPPHAHHLSSQFSDSLSRKSFNHARFGRSEFLQG